MLRPARLSHSALHTGATACSRVRRGVRSFCAPSSVDELAAAVAASCRHGLLHDEIASSGQWEAVDRRHRLCVICTQPAAVSASAANCRYIPGGLLR